METNTPAKTNPGAPVPQAVEAALLFGDISRLTPEQKLGYYKQLCESVGLNPLTRPFDFMKGRDGGEKPYANKNCAEQLRRIHGISLTISSRDKIESLYIVTARAIGKDGRQDESTAAIDLLGLKGEALANALMKCETKAKRRVTLSYCGLGMLDESEVETVPGVTKVGFNPGAVEPTAPSAPAVTLIPDAEQPPATLPEPEENPWNWKLEISADYREKAKLGGKRLEGMALFNIPTKVLTAYPLPAKRPAFTERDIANIMAALLDESLRTKAIEDATKPAVSFEEDDVPDFNGREEANAA